MALYDPYGRLIDPSQSRGDDPEHRHENKSCDSAESHAVANPHESPRRTPSNSSLVDSQKDTGTAYEEKQSRVQTWGLAIQVVLCILNTLAVCAAVYYARVATLQFGVMQRQLEATDRPWIKITIVKPREDFTFFHTRNKASEQNWKIQANETISIVAKNIGHSVAQRVFVKGKMTFTENTRELINEQNSVCSGPPSYAFPVNLFPDEDTGNSQFIIGADIVPPPEKSKPSLIGGMEVPWNLPLDTWIASPKFVGCFVYTSANTGSTHYTGFIYGMEQEVHSPFLGAPDYDARFFKIGEKISKSKLNINPYIFGFDLN